MTTRLIIILVIITIFGLSMPRETHAFGIADVRNIIDTIKNGLNLLKVPRAISGITSSIPHNFPFGGHIISSENACSLKFRPWIPNPGCIIGLCIPPMVPTISISVIRFGTAIEVGPPIPTNGKIITFPYISDIYRNNQEDRVGPWALGLGFTPFPLDKLNDALRTLRFPNPLISCALQAPFCVDNIHIDCQTSGEKDTAGNDIYKVILKLGTSP